MGKGKTRKKLSSLPGSAFTIQSIKKKGELGLYYIYSALMILSVMLSHCLNDVLLNRTRGQEQREGRSGRDGKGGRKRGTARRGGGGGGRREEEEEGREREKERERG